MTILGTSLVFLLVFIITLKSAGSTEIGVIFNSTPFPNLTMS